MSGRLTRSVAALLTGSSRPRIHQRRPGRRRMCAQLKTDDGCV